jgi:hypothetical protein
MTKFHGSLGELQELLRNCSIPGEWQFHKANKFYRFRAATGAILNWWPSTGTINFQGQGAEEFEALILQHARWLGCDASVWAAVPDPTPCPDRLPDARSFAYPEDQRTLASRTSQRLGPRVIELLPAPKRDRTGT